ncbi:hydroxyacid dehydrogenase [Acuticoccus mangrovi]|uniref:Hydroxyacid dehydrogenase n=1 Tax=Acuticoccus mangrovi TaxID=2796142 RepID=A0A934ILE2_9HYPH|nr:hydroxyacid dehydrogenase [Acuticoccus mangrovi]
MICLVIQPIHPKGLALLADAGIETRLASAATMDVVANEIADCDAAITRNAGLNRAAMEAAPKLKVLGNHGIGVDPVDVVYASEIGLPIVFTPYGNVQSVAELVFAHLFAIEKRVREADAAVREGNFDYRYTRDFREVTEKRLLIVGFGRIGRRTADIAKAAFQMEVSVHSPSVPEADIVAAGFTPAPDLPVALKSADYVSLHQTLTDKTRGMFDAALLGAMKPGAILINTARGALVDPQALADAVTGGHLRGAAMDVFAPEPPPADHPWLTLPGILLSPHIGGATEEALERTAMQTAGQVVDVLNGRRPEYLVNPTVWERRRGA